jgi:amidase
MSSYPPDTRRVLAALLELARHPDQARAVLAYMTRQSLLRQWGRFQEEHPLIVAPVSTDVPFAAGKGYTTAEVAEIIHGLRMTTAVNGLGLPAVAVPVGIGEGLPQAVQVIGPRYREDLCLTAAAAIEDGVGTFTPIDPHRVG